jgi:hypothetical protein
MNKLREREKRIKKLKEIIKTQCNDGNWNYDLYMHGMTNGLILAESIIEDIDTPVFLDPPDKFLCDSKKEEQVKKQMYRILENAVVSQDCLGLEISSLRTYFRPLFQDSDIENMGELLLLFAKFIGTLDTTNDCIRIESKSNNKEILGSMWYKIIRTPKKPKLIEPRDVDPDKEYWLQNYVGNWVGPVKIESVNFTDKVDRFYAVLEDGVGWFTNCTLEDMGEK